MAFDFAKNLQTVKDRQWALADIDWDAPGAERIGDEQREKLKAFMVDLVWIENVGARGFAALAKKAPDETLKQTYTYFHAEEQKHANAELALMRRWGMVAEGEAFPEPNVNVRMAIQWLDRYSDDMSLSVLGTVIPMLECALDGALVKFLLDEVEDPLCHEVFRHINSDESRHLAVGFAVLDMLGAGPLRRVMVQSLGSLLHPSLLLGVLVYIPLLNKMRDNIVHMGMSEQKLYTAMGRFAGAGKRSANTRRLLSYRLLREHAAMVIDRTHPYHRLVADPMVKLTGLIPPRLLGKSPTWAKELTSEPVAK